MRVTAMEGQIVKTAHESARHQPLNHCGRVLLVGMEYVLRQKVARSLFWGDCRAQIAGRAATPVDALPRLKSGAIDIVLLGREFGPEELLSFAAHAKKAGYGGIIVQPEQPLDHSTAPARSRRSAQVRVGDFVIDVDSHRVWVRKLEIQLTPQEFALLAYFSKHPGKLLQHDDLRQVLWGSSAAPIEPLRVLIKSLRTKVEPETTPRYIVTQHRLGYRFHPSPVLVRTGSGSTTTKTNLRIQVPSKLRAS
jgi:DNA-binding winged helix-turn-helix (wHTH) protein